MLVCCRQYEANEGSVSALRHAIELRFAANSRTAYSLQDHVVLDLFTKNIGTEVGAGTRVVSWQDPSCAEAGKVLGQGKAGNATIGNRGVVCENAQVCCCLGFVLAAAYIRLCTAGGALHVVRGVGSTA